MMFPRARFLSFFESSPDLCNAFFLCHAAVVPQQMSRVGYKVAQLFTAVLFGNYQYLEADPHGAYIDLAFGAGNHEPAGIFGGLIPGGATSLDRLGIAPFTRIWARMGLVP